MGYICILNGYICNLNSFIGVQSGNTALMMAAYLGHVESVRVLVQGGADLTLADEVRLV